jgi:hypothetical protein
MFSAGEKELQRSVTSASRGFGEQRRKRKKKSEEFGMVK